MDSMISTSEQVEVQAAAKAVIAELAASIRADDTERTIAGRATSLLSAGGITETWYYNCPALVLLGSRSCLSLSGRDYVPSDEPVGAFNVITVDLSPSRGSLWGDCARTIPIENGRCTFTPRESEIKRGLQVEALLHRAMRGFVTPQTTFEELFDFGNAEIKRLSFENLDYLGNLGHSIVTRLDDRQYIVSGNNMPLSSVPFFTFEPHVRQAGGKWGFKHEEIYYFDAEQQLHAL